MVLFVLRISLWPLCWLWYPVDCQHAAHIGLSLPLHPPVFCQSSHPLHAGLGLAQRNQRPSSFVVNYSDFIYQL